MGYQVLQVYSATEASNILFNQRIKPELLFCDVNMPQKSGFDLLREVILKNIDIRVCMISGDNERANRLESLQLGALDFISKPLEMGKLNETVSKLLNQPSVQ